ncbi:MAG: FAD-dependent thymidylate synthase [Candidatus Diapherotrites archaeon]
MPETKLNVKLLRYTFEPEIAAALGAKMCYNKVGIDELVEGMTKEKAEKLLNHIIDVGHHSVLEHASFTFAVEGISRACSHQLVRHRIASYSQQSQRYVDLSSFNFIVPPSIKGNQKALQKFNEALEKTKEAYGELVKDAPKEDARFILPNAIETKIVITMNTRSLYNFFEKRLCTRAQWEIRALAQKMLEEVMKVAPLLFKECGPSCKTIGLCREGKNACNLYKVYGARLKEIRQL